MVSLPPPNSDPQETEEGRSSVQRTNSTPLPPQILPKATGSAHRTPSTGVPTLKKRPSTFTLPSSLTPISPPLLSPASQSDYNVSRIRPVAVDIPPPLTRKSSTRPSTANSREEVTPWEFQLSPFETTPTSPIDDKFAKTPTPALKSKPSSIKSKPPSVKSAHQPSSRSRTSATATGLVEDVTPWELYPPILEKNTKYHHPTETIPEYTQSLNNPPPTTTTGFVEDVTPWELVLPPTPQESSRKSSPRAPSYLTSVDETSTLVSYDSSSQQYRQQPSPAPPSIQHSHVSRASSQDHKVVKTGPSEDATPWEVESEPTPSSTSTLEGREETGTSRIRSSMTLAQVEEVTPWELHPVPSSPPPLDDIAKDAKAVGGSTVKKKTSSSGNSFASSSGRGKTDLSLVRGRKQGSTMPSKSKHISEHQSAGPQPHSSVQYVSVPPSDQVDDYGDEVPQHAHSRALDLPSTPRGASKPPSPVTTPIPIPVAPTALVNSKVAKSEPPSRSQFNMSTADRKILTQLEYYKDIHDREFILKGKGYHQQGGGVTPGKIHHAYDEKKAPYPRCYDARAQDLDVWEIMICRQTCNSWTWHVFKEPPTAVLDIGCGTGSWITHAAGAWKECHFWGVDLVPTQPDFTTLGDRDLKERIHWVHANFLAGLPFEDEKFDYIHIKRIGLGVPENKWDSLFEECKRVLKPGGAFELIEEDLLFPGKPNDTNELPPNILKALEEEYDVSPNRSLRATNDPSVNRSASTNTTANTSALASMDGSGWDKSHDIPPTAQTSFLPAPSEASPSTSEFIRHENFTNGEIRHDRNMPLPPLPTSVPSTNSRPDHVLMVLPHSRSTAKPNLSIKTTSDSHNLSFANSVVSLLHSLGHPSPIPDEYTGSAPRRRSPNAVGLAKESHPQGGRSRASSSHETRSQASVESTLALNGKRAAKHEPYLTKAPRNPRDHAILETIYTEMLALRFINPTPLSIIQNYLEYHFTDVRTHPPLLYTFPPTALLHSESRYVTDSETESQSSDEFFSDDEEARDAIRPKPSNPKVAKDFSHTSDGPRSRYRCILGKPAEDAPDTLRFLSFPDLIRQRSPYVSFDGTRGYAFSPSTPANRRRSIDGKSAVPMRLSRLPNRALNIDLKTLNMHLYLRTVDILGCSEPMWEWVVKYQSKRAKRTSNDTGPAPGGAIRPSQSDASLNSVPSIDPNELIMDGIAEMNRDDFEMLLANFELDMQDQASVDYALQEQVNWRVFASPRDLKRKAFDDSCKKWDKWVAKRERRDRYLARHPLRSGNNQIQTSQDPRYRHSSDLLSPPSAGSHNGIANGHGGGDSSGKRISVRRDSSIPSPIPFSPSSLPPHRRLSRAIRVFVAWKARDPHSPNQAVPTYNGFDTPIAL